MCLKLIEYVIDYLHNQAPRWLWVFENYISYFPTKTYVVGTQKNSLT